MNWPWGELGLAGPADLAQIHRAYAERLKTTHPEEDPEGFQRLNQAYQQARRLARRGGGGERPVPPPQPEPQPQLEEPDWDYEGIFTQEAAKRARERERHVQERRDAYFAVHVSGTWEEAKRREVQWASLERALTTVEELHASGAPLSGWVEFLYSSAFFAVKGDENFVAGLEDFLRRNPDLDEQVKQELSKAFGLRHGEVPSLWQGLRELLGAGGSGARGKEKKTLKNGRAALRAILTLWRRRGRCRTEVTQPRNDVELWLVGTYAIWGQFYAGLFPQWRDAAEKGPFHIGAVPRTPETVEEMKGTLDESWDITSYQELLDTVEYMSTGPGFQNCVNQAGRAWELCRSMQLLGCAYLVEWCGREEMVCRSCAVGKLIQSTFHSWDELCQSFLDGFAAWRLSGGMPREAAQAAVQKRADIYWLLKRRKDSPYSLPWLLELDPRQGKARR